MRDGEEEITLAVDRRCARRPCISKTAKVKRYRDQPVYMTERSGKN
jgi:hypothetical protein